MQLNTIQHLIVQYYNSTILNSATKTIAITNSAKATIASATCATLDRAA